VIATPCIKVASDNLIQFSRFFFNLAGLTRKVLIITPAHKHKYSTKQFKYTERENTKQTKQKRYGSRRKIGI